MEQMESKIFGSGLDETSKAYLLETTRWTKFLAIMVFLGSAFSILFALLLMVYGTKLGISSGNESLFMFIYLLVLSALYIYPGIALFKFSAMIKQGIHTDNQEQINEGFRYQKNFFRYIGILTIIALAIILISFVLGGLAGMGQIA